MRTECEAIEGVTDTPLREIEALLYREAELLYTGNYRAWLELLTEDVTYQLPQRLTWERAQGPGVIPGTVYFLETHWTLHKSIGRLEMEYTWVGDPRSRTRRFVDNIRVEPGETSEEVGFHTNVLA